MRKLLIAGDSLSMTRHVDGLSFEETYAVMTQMAHPGSLVINGSLRANSSRMLASQEYLDEYVRPLRPDHVVVQIGIVDCTPRLFTPAQKRALSIMKRVPGLRNAADLVIRSASRRRRQITRRRSRPLVPAAEFAAKTREFVATIRSSNASCGLSIVNIPCPATAFLQRNYGVAELIAQYNALLAQIANESGGGVIDLHAHTSTEPSSLLADGYHINAHAHRFLYGELAAHLRLTQFGTEQT